MKQYIPDLIPNKHRVLPDYFREPTPSKTSSTTSAADTLWSALAAVAMLTALVVWSKHSGFGLSLLVLAFFAVPWGRHRVEKALRFRFTPTLKASTVGILILTSVLTGQQYRGRVAQTVEAERLAAVAKQKAEAEAHRKGMLRLDSLRTYLTKADASLKKGTYAKAIGLYKRSLRFTAESDRSEQHRAWAGLASGYFQTKQYLSALQQYENLLSEGESDAEYYYRRALCYQKVGRRQAALVDLHQASEAGYAPATKLYNRLNPELRRVLYYQTVCCDGSYSPSNAKGRGACSHHGGVCNWDKPIYETYRKYDVNGL